MFTSKTAAEIREMDDEGLQEAWSLATSLRLPALGNRLYAEIGRRAEIKMERRMDVEYGSNRYGFTLDDIAADHDASWYESRQTEDEWLAESGQKCESGWTGDRCTFPLFHEGPHSN